MNYRHAYHAGNFADVVKHVLLARVITYMKRKDAAFRVIDTHAGAGRYALDATAAEKTGEWRRGIARLLGPDAAPIDAPLQDLLAPYVDAIGTENPDGLTRYPGSPALALALLRAQDVLVANELHPEDRADLAREIGRDRRVRVLGLDGYVAIRSLLPPKERRAIVLIDPPFEQAGEFERMTDALRDIQRRFEPATALLWYPIKDRRAVERWHTALATVAGGLLGMHVFTGAAATGQSLIGCGVVAYNPPFTLAGEARSLLPVLARRMAVGADARAAVFNIGAQN